VVASRLSTPQASRLDVAEHVQTGELFDEGLSCERRSHRPAYEGGDHLELVA
jgi:hypothetical protein